MLTVTKKLVAVAAATSIFATDFAVAQSLDEITVTARKRDESALEVPLSIQVFSAEQISEAGMSDLENLAAFTPGLDFQAAGSSQGGRYNPNMRFRGMDTQIIIPLNPTAAFLVDGISIAAGTQSIGYADVQRVEIIRGPQPVFFGRGTFGGALNYITKDPSEEFGGSASAEYSPTFGSHNLSLSLENSLIEDKLAGRITVSSVAKGAMFTATDGGLLGEQRTDSLSATLLFTPTDTLSIKARATYSVDNDGPGASTFVDFRNNGTCAAGTPVSYVTTDDGLVNGALATPYACGNLPYLSPSSNTGFYTIDDSLVGPAPGQVINTRDVILDPNNIATGTPNLTSFGLEAEFHNYSITADWEISEALSATFLIGSNERAVTQIRDGDGTDRLGWISKGFMLLDSKTYEARLSFDNGGRVRGLFGASYFDSAQSGDIDGGFGVVTNLFGGVATTNFRDDSEIETLGIFASVEFDVTDSLSVSLEARYQDEEKRDGLTNIIGSGAPTIFADPLKSKKTLPRVIVSYGPTDNSTLYASYSEGNLPGATNTFLLGLSDAARASYDAANPGVGLTIDDETVENLEIGWKQEFESINAWLAVSVYSMDWTNMKSSGFTPFFNPDTGLNDFRSASLAGNSELKGVEFEGYWAPTEQLDFRLGLGFSDATYTDYIFSTFNNRLGIPRPNNYKADGNTLPRSPELKGSLSATWSGSQPILGGAWQWALRGDFIHNGESFTDQSNLASIAAYDIFNMRFSLMNDENVVVELFCKNCADEEGWRTGSRSTDLSIVDIPNFFSFQGSWAQPLDPREFGFRVLYDF